MTRRNIELMLLLIASPIVIVLFAMMVVTGGQELSFNTLGVPLGHLRRIPRRAHCRALARPGG